MTEEIEHKVIRKGNKINIKSITREKIEETKKKCLQVVERLLEPSVSEDLLISLCSSISQDDYLDVVEERNILLLCGYPLCSKGVKSIKQKYQISMKTNKVYDITERKCFCSNGCYKASNFLKAQLSSCPVWLKDKDKEEKPITLLSTTKNSGSAGEEIDFGHKRMTANDIEWVPDEESLSDNMYSSYLSDDLEAFNTEFEKLEMSEQHVKSQSTVSTERTVTSEEKDQGSGENVMLLPNSNGDRISVITEKYVEDSKSAVQPITQHPYLDSDDDDYADLSEEHKKYESLISDNKYMPVIPKAKVRKALLIDPVGNPDTVLSLSATGKANDSLQHVQNALLSWISADTFRIILGESEFELLKSEILGNAESPGPHLETSSAEKLEAVKQTYTKICVKLEREEAVELNSNVGSDEKSNLGPEVDAERLCESKENLDQFKVSMFYKGEIGLPETPANKKKAKKKSKSTPSKNIKKEPSGKCPVRRKETEPVTPSTPRDVSVLPVIESMSQSVIRRQIVADHLKIVYLNMLPLVGLHYRDISEDFRVLISTFNLSSTNISFKPPAWKVIAVILFRMIEKKLTTEKVWNQEKCWELLKAKLVSFDITLDQIDTLLASLTDHSRLKALLLGY